MKQPLQPIEAAASSVLARLRHAIPPVQLRYSSALKMAERLATELLELYDVREPPVSSAIVTDLPKIRLTVEQSLPALTSGFSVWNNRLGSWVITVNGHEPSTRQRFTIFHELFHIAVHRHVERHGLFDELSPAQIEYIADYFAGCVLAPKPLLNRAWGSGIQRPEALGRLFDVSPQAIAVRLKQVGLTATDDLGDASFEGAAR